jgi:hypothetical protein
MGFLDKIIGKIGNHALERSIIDHYIKFLTTPGEYDETILQCSDVNYSINIFNDFLRKYKPANDGEDYGFCDFCRFQFEECIYEIYMFKHYARALTVSLLHELNEKCNLAEIYCLCNAINTVDLIHQVGVCTYNGKHYLRITKQILCTPNIGDADTMAQSFRDLKAYFLTVSDMNFFNLEESDLTAWKKYTSITPRTKVDNAEDFWFSDVDSALSDFRKTSKIIREDAYSKTRSMIKILKSYEKRLGDETFLRGEITTYKQYPYLVSMKTSITEGVNGVSKINIEKAESLCAEWNGVVHFSPIRVVMNKDDSNKITVSIIMTGLFADDCNTRTYVDFLCTLQKITKQLATLC